MLYEGEHIMIVATMKTCSRYLMGFSMAVLLAPLSASAETVTGKINGLKCALSGFICPVEQIDAMVALEDDFVLQQASGNYYLMTNLDRSLKARYALQEVTVTGTVSQFYKAIDVETFQVGGRTVWSKKMRADVEKQMRRALYGGS